MFKSLYSGVSGLSANLTNLDVIGNNIANSNTTGFKSGRVTFNEMLTQTMRSASRPVSGGLGGTNPQQVGLGTQIGSIDTNFNQGNFRTTGKKTDLAIQGPGFFVMSDGASKVYTRAGVFGLDSENVIVNPSTGLRVQGVMADTEGVLGTGPMTDIFIDPGLVVPASPSTSVQLMGNLDSNSDAKGTIRESGIFLTAAEGADALLDMSGQENGLLNMHIGDAISINGRAASTGDDLSTASFTIAEDSTYQELVDWLNAEIAGVTAAIGANGQLEVTNNTGDDIEGFGLVGSSELTNSFALPAVIANGTMEASSELRAYATETDTMDSLYNIDGEPLDIDFSTPPTDLILGGNVGGTLIDNQTITITAATTLAEILQDIQFGLGINTTPVVMNDTGQIVVSGEVGVDNAIGDISMSEDGTTNSVLGDLFRGTETQQAVDQKSYSMATTIYDSLGGEHTISFEFQKVAGMNEWTWTADVEGNETIISGGSGRARFSEEGAITNFTFDDGSGSVVIQPQVTGEEGATNINLGIDYGEIGALTGLTQFEGSGNLQSIADGYGTGSLVDFNIDQSGVITGIFTNDTMQNIAQIAIAQFSNSDGLMREANNTYRRSGNSGQAVEAFAGSGIGVTLVPGALETSNVDLAAEFTNLVVAQRAFQANSRVITTADQVMQELVNLIR
ncbi:MAG: flagellar hook-basal body complex protein [Gemmatimonadales bacterium]|nr:flagellar hook-basal body complex protein [Gemmatimonadales bacterium]